MVSLANVEGKITVQKASVSGRVLGSATSATKSTPRRRWAGGGSTCRRSSRSTSSASSNLRSLHRLGFAPAKGAPPKVEHPTRTARCSCRMSTRKDENDRIALLQGTLDLLILRTLLFGPQHGQGIARAIQLQSEDTLLVDHGSLYPAVQRLESRGWIRAEWGTS